MNILACFFDMLLSCLLLCGCSQQNGDPGKSAKQGHIVSRLKAPIASAPKEPLPVIKHGTDRKLIEFLSFFRIAKVPLPVGYADEELLKDTVEDGRPIEKDSIRRLPDAVVRQYLLLAGEGLYKNEQYDTTRYNFYPISFCIATPKYYGVVIERYLTSFEGTSEKFYYTLDLQGRLIDRIRIAACDFAGYETTLNDGRRGPWWMISDGLIKNHIELYGDDDGRIACYTVNEGGRISLVRKVSYDSARNSKSMLPSEEDISLMNINLTHQ